MRNNRFGGETATISHDPHFFQFLHFPYLPDPIYIHTLITYTYILKITYYVLFIQVVHIHNAQIDRQKDN